MCEDAEKKVHDLVDRKFTADDSELHLRFVTVAIIGIRLALERKQFHATPGLKEAAACLHSETQRLRNSVL